jgi:hypothetical protein
VAMGARCSYVAHDRAGAKGGTAVVVQRASFALHLRQVWRPQTVVDSAPYVEHAVVYRPVSFCHPPRLICSCLRSEDGVDGGRLCLKAHWWHLSSDVVGELGGRSHGLG